MKRLLVLLVPVAVFFGVLAAPANGDPFTEHFNALRSEVESRIDSLDGELTKDQAKQKKALTKILRYLDKDSSDLMGDIKTALRVTKAITKGAPEDQALGTLLDDVLQAIENDVVEATDELAAQLEVLPESKWLDKAAAKLPIVEALLGDLEFRDSAIDLLKTLKKVLQKSRRVEKVVDKAFDKKECRYVHTGDVAATINGQSWISTNAYTSIVVSPAGEIREFDIHAYRDSGGINGERIYIYLNWESPGLPGPGTYAFTNGNAMKAYFWDEGDDSREGSGSVTITTLDMERKIVAGTFEFEVNGDAGHITVTSGTFYIPCAYAWLDDLNY